MQYLFVSEKRMLCIQMEILDMLIAVMGRPFFLKYFLDTTCNNDVCSVLKSSITIYLYCYSSPIN